MSWGIKDSIVSYNTEERWSKRNYIGDKDFLSFVEDLDLASQLLGIDKDRVSLAREYCETGHTVRVLAEKYNFTVSVTNYYIDEVLRHYTWHKFSSIDNSIFKMTLPKSIKLNLWRNNIRTKEDLISWFNAIESKKVGDVTVYEFSDDTKIRGLGLKALSVIKEALDAEV